MVSDEAICDPDFSTTCFRSRDFQMQAFQAQDFQA
jgi:hypothetical protein